MNRYRFLRLELAESPLCPRSLLDRLDEGVERLRESRPLRGPALERLRRHLIVEYIYNSNAVEGNTLTLGETRLVLEEGVTVSGKPLRDHLEAKNHLPALEYVEELARGRKPIEEFDLLKLHHLLMLGIEEARPGRYREGLVLIAGSRYVPPPAGEVPRLVRRFLDWLNSGPDLHPVELAAVAHAYLVAIHPFEDGNGRTARLLMNLLLMRAGYPMAVIRRERRRSYLRALEAADSGNARPIARLVARAVDESLTLYLAAATGLVPLARVAREAGLSVDYLGQLARKGYVRATKLAGRWYVPPEEAERLRSSQ